MNIEIPDNWLGKPVEGALERALRNPNPTLPVSDSILPANNTGLNKEDYIILPSQTHGDYIYGDTLVSMKREYLGKNWDESWNLLKSDGAYMLNIRQFVDFLKLLRSGNAFDEHGNKVQPSRLMELYNDITEVRDPWRSEWLDAKFNIQVVGKKWAGLVNKDVMHITYHIVNSQGVLTEVNEPLEHYLANDKIPGINLDDWIMSVNKHGLPTEDNPDGELYYWKPVDCRVARFDASSGGTGLLCSGGPSFVYSLLGVRPARAKI